MSMPGDGSAWDVMESYRRLQTAVIKLTAWQGITPQDLIDEELLQKEDLE